MWQLLLVAAVAGSTGFIANYFLTQTKQCTDTSDDPDTPLEPPISQPLPLSNVFSQRNFDIHDGIFRFSSSESLGKDSLRSRTNDSRKKPLIGRQQSKHGIRIAKLEQRSDVQVRSEQDCSSFGWGLSFGIMYMMSAGKSEISKLHKAMDETAKVVQELKSELHQRKSSRTKNILDFVENNDFNSCKMSGRNDEVMLKKTNNEVKDIDIRTSSFPAVSDDGECGSSAVTEESDQRVLEMEQLEAELEFELQKLPGCTIDSPYHEEMIPKLHELQVADERCYGSETHGVLASELNQKLSHLLIERQKNQIAELESELHLAQFKLHEKETELQALKNYVRRLTELSLSTVSDDETDAGLIKKEEAKERT